MVITHIRLWPTVQQDNKKQNILLHLMITWLTSWLINTHFEVMKQNFISNYFKRNLQWNPYSFELSNDQLQQLRNALFSPLVQDDIEECSTKIPA